MKRMKLRNTVRKQITTLAGIRRKLLIRKVSKGQRNLIRLTKFSICFLKYGFLKYIHRFKLMKLTETLITFASVKLQSNYFNQSHCATSSHPGSQVLLFLSRSFYLGFHKYSRITGVQGKGKSISSTNHRSTREGEGYFFNSSLSLPPALQALRHQPDESRRALTSADSQQIAGLEPGHFGFRAQVANH